MKNKFSKFRTFKVVVKQSGLARTLWSDQIVVPIISDSAANACNAIKDEFLPLIEHPTEFICTGRKGGMVSRFAGWETLIGAQMWAARSEFNQLTFSL